MPTARQTQAFQFFCSQGYSSNGSAAIVGNLTQESGVNLDSTIYRAHPDHGSGGIAEWRLDRLTNLIHFGGDKVGDLDVQCSFLIHELTTEPQYAALNIELHDPHRSVQNLTENFCWVFERPNARLANISRRIAVAKSLVNTTPPIAPHVAVVAGAAAASQIVLHGPEWFAVIVISLSGFFYLLHLGFQAYKGRPPKPPSSHEALRAAIEAHKHTADLLVAAKEVVLSEVTEAKSLLELAA
jgi:hypothetical protein